MGSINRTIILAAIAVALVAGAAIVMTVRTPHQVATAANKAADRIGREASVYPPSFA
jgi:hypothetical protein